MKKLLALSILLVSACPAGAQMMQGPLASATPETVIATETNTNTAKVDALEKAIRAKSDALSGRLKFGSLSSLPTTDANGTYDPKAIQVVEALRNAVKGMDLKSYSKSLSRSSQSTKYNSILASEKAAAEAAKAAQIIEEAEEKEESKDPIVTPEKGETEEKTEAVITWEFDATTGKYVEYSDGKATGNTKDAVDNFSKETDTIQWAVDDKQVYVEHLTTKTIVIGDSAVTVYIRENGDIYAIADDNIQLKWKDANDAQKQMVTLKLEELRLKEDPNFKSYTDREDTVKIFFDANGNYTEVAIFRDGEIKTVLKWSELSEEQKAEIMNNLDKPSGESEEQQTKLNEYTIDGGWATFTIYYDNDGNILKVGRVFEDGSDVLDFNEMNETDQNHWKEELNNYLHPSSSEEQQEVKTNEYTFEWKGSQVTVYYDDDAKISNVDIERDGETTHYAWDDLGDDAHKTITEELNNYLHPSSSEESSEEQVGNNVVSQIDSKGNIIKYYYDNENSFVKWELVTPEGEILNSRSASEMAYDEISFNQEKLNEMLNSSSSEEEEEEKPITFQHEVVQSKSGENVNVYYDATNNVVSIGIMDENGIEVYNQSVDDMDVVSRAYYQQQLNEKLNLPSSEEMKERKIIDLTSEYTEIAEQENRINSLTSTISALETSLNDLTNQVYQAMMEGDEDNAERINADIEEQTETLNSAIKQKEECQEAIAGLTQAINSKLAEAEDYKQQGYEVEIIGEQLAEEK